MAILAVVFLLPHTQNHPAIEVGEDRLLSTSGPAHPLAESQLSANPNNTKQLLAVVIQFGPPRGNNPACVSWASFDGGQSWTRRVLPIQCFADPWGAILPDGSAVAVALGHVNAHEDNAFLLRSPDGGRTWPDTPLGLGTRHDHPMVVARGNDVYVVSSQGVAINDSQRRSSAFVLYSHDGGKTFGQPTHAVPSNLLGFAAVGPTILSDGTLVVGIHDPKRQEDPASEPRSWLLRSSDRGQTFSEPLLVSTSCESRGGWPSTAVDGKDRLFWLCIAGKFNGVLVQRSDDRGGSWSAPVRVNHTDKADSFTPSIAVNKAGVIGVSWYEVDDKTCFDVYFTASLNGGKSFLREVKVSSVTSCPDTSQNKGVFTPGMTFGAGGDYSGLVATSDGIFHVIWSDARSSVYQLRTATVAVKP